MDEAPAEARPVDENSATEEKPADPAVTPADLQARKGPEGPAAEAQPVDEASAEARPVDENSATEEKPADPAVTPADLQARKGPEGPAAEAQPVDEASAEARPVDENSATEEKPADPAVTPADLQARKGPEGPAAEAQPVDKDSAEAQPVDEISATEEKPADPAVSAQDHQNPTIAVTPVGPPAPVEAQPAGPPEPAQDLPTLSNLGLSEPKEEGLADLFSSADLDLGATVSPEAVTVFEALQRHEAKHDVTTTFMVYDIGLDYFALGSILTETASEGERELFVRVWFAHAANVAHLKEYITEAASQRASNDNCSSFNVYCAPNDKTKCGGLFA